MNDDLILLGHGSGGALSHRLLDDLIIPALSGISPANQNDAAVLVTGDSRLAFTTDGYVVDPPIFPGGTIGSLSVHGTVNDLAMMGARPLWLSCGLIIEEGLERSLLAEILADLRRAADEAGVQIVTGDTKVVPRGKADRIFITTSGVGIIEHNLSIHGGAAGPATGSSSPAAWGTMALPSWRPARDYPLTACRAIPHRSGRWWQRCLRRGGSSSSAA